MPMDCRGGSQHNNIGCGGTTAGNGTGKYIKPGDPTNVYEKFVVEANALFGEYNDCNPILDGPDAGTFACEAEDDGTHCVCPGHVGVEWQQMWDDCLNGTVYSALRVNASACQARCADDSKCDAYALPEGDGANVCHLLKQPLIFWEGGQHKSSCQAQIKEISSLGVPGSECACNRFAHVAVGKQLNSFGSVPGLPCVDFKTERTCDNTDGCQWRPGCCRWTGHGQGDDGWDCDDCCKNCHCCDGDACDDCDCCPFGRAFQNKHPNASGLCQPHTCANHTCSSDRRPQDCADDCNGDDDCVWNNKTQTCGQFACSNLKTAKTCGEFSRRDCSWDEANGCSGGWNHNSPPNVWR